MTVEDIILKRIGLDIAAGRKSMGLNQTDFAEKADLTRKDISRLENGIPGVPWQKMFKAVSALDKPIDSVVVGVMGKDGWT